jgi:hypothetical protein
LDLLMYSRFTPTCFGKWLPSSGGVGALKATQVISVLWTYKDYDLSNVAMTTGHTGWIVIRIRSQYRYYLSSF